MSAISAIEQPSGTDNVNSNSVTPIYVTGVLATTSASNASKVIVIDLRNCSSVLSINMATSGGTATVTVDVSLDNTTFINQGASAANAHTALTFSSAKSVTPEATGGAYTVAADLQPLAFRYVKVTAGAAGAGNTTTTTISAK